MREESPSNLRMPLDPEKLEKPLRKLSKLLRKLPRQPSPEQVHDIRTGTRRAEAALHALMFDRDRRGKRTLKSVTPVRKRAGKVRDMDVLTGLAATLSNIGDKECLVQLFEYLGHRRFQDARKLHKTAAQQRTIATQSLKRCRASILRDLQDKDGQSHLPADTAGVALQLSGELVKWPKLTAYNLHPFRLKVKELRYVLQLSGEDSDLIEMLGEVKDKIGEWHDWTELAKIAVDVLRHPGRCDVREQIRATAKQQFSEAITLANRLRTQYFTPAERKNQRGAVGKKAKPVPVLLATERLAA